MPAIPPRLLRAYRNTRYRVGSVPMRIGDRSAAVDALLASHRARTAVLISAWNPRSRRMPLGWNRRMQNALARRLRRCPTLPAEGVWRDWSEAHLLALGPVAPVAILARRFRQFAIVVLRRGAPASLLAV
jgi:Protein of unknown function (DUF3293)